MPEGEFNHLVQQGVMIGAGWGLAFGVVSSLSWRFVHWFLDWAFPPSPEVQP